MPAVTSDKILDTVEAFLETHPDLETSTIEFAERVEGENSTCRFMKVTINEEVYLVIAKRVGG